MDYLLEDENLAMSDLLQLYKKSSDSEAELSLQNNHLQEQLNHLTKKSKMLELAMDASNDALWVVDIKTGERYVTNYWHEKIGFTSSPRIGEAWNKRIHPEDREKADREFVDLLEGKVSSIEQFYRIMEESSGEYRWVRVRGKAFSDDDGKPHLLAGVNVDIDKLKKQEELLEHLAFHDSLTNLPNRGLYINRLELFIKLAQRQKMKAAVLFIDFDHFKMINDSMGHSAGDDFLKQASRRIESQIREYDTLARFGGDEFALLFQDVTTIEEIAYLSTRVKDCFIDPFMINMSSICLSCSIGIAVYPDNGTTAEELLKNADMAMYKAKEHGRNNIQFFNQAMKDELISTITIERELRNAIANHEFELHFQPQFNLSDNRCRGYEALLRWNNRLLGGISPLQFIHIAEETGLILSIGEWVLNQACSSAQTWKKQYGFNGIISVNISAIQLGNADFVNIVQKALSISGLHPANLELEITESILIDSLTTVVAKLDELNNMGVRISLDDFGTGYSSLNYLMQLPIQTLKIDKSFVDQIKPESKKVINAIVSLTHDLGISTIAEGAETQEQYDYLKQAGCEMIQGYFTGRPITEQRVIESFESDND